MLDIDQKIRIISQSAYSYRDEEVLEDFFEYNDIGVPLSRCVNYGLCELTSEGEQAIEETWTYLCIACNKDPNGYYENIDDLTKNVIDDE